MSSSDAGSVHSGMSAAHSAPPSYGEPYASGDDGPPLLPPAGRGMPPAVDGRGYYQAAPTGPVLADTTQPYEIPVGNITLPSGEQKGISVVVLDQFGMPMNMQPGTNFLPPDLAQRMQRLVDTTTASFTPHIPTPYVPERIARDGTGIPRLEAIDPNTGSYLDPRQPTSPDLSLRHITYGRAGTAEDEWNDLEQSILGIFRQSQPHLRPFPAQMTARMSGDGDPMADGRGVDIDLRRMDGYDGSGSGSEASLRSHSRRHHRRMPPPRGASSGDEAGDAAAAAGLLAARSRAHPSRVPASFDASAPLSAPAATLLRGAPPPRTLDLRGSGADDARDARRLAAAEGDGTTSVEEESDGGSSSSASRRATPLHARRAAHHHSSLGDLRRPDGGLRRDRMLRDGESALPAGTFLGPGTLVPAGRDPRGRRREEVVADAATLSEGGRRERRRHRRHSSRSSGRGSPPHRFGPGTALVAPTRGLPRHPAALPTHPEVAAEEGSSGSDSDRAGRGYHPYSDGTPLGPPAARMRRRRADAPLPHFASASADEAAPVSTRRGPPRPRVSRRDPPRDEAVYARPAATAATHRAGAATPLSELTREHGRFPAADSTLRGLDEEGARSQQLAEITRQLLDKQADMLAYQQRRMGVESLGETPRLLGEYCRLKGYGHMELNSQIRLFQADQRRAAAQ